MLYDHKRSVIILAEKPINQLCSINTLKKAVDGMIVLFPFEVPLFEKHQIHKCK